jgi:hypothetical protein
MPRELDEYAWRSNDIPKYDLQQMFEDEKKKAEMKIINEKLEVVKK